MGPKEPLHAFYLELSIFAQRFYKTIQQRPICQSKPLLQKKKKKKNHFCLSSNGLRIISKWLHYRLINQSSLKQST